MIARETRLNELMKVNDQKFSIPIFQRKYSWTEKQCMTLWEDILKLSELEKNRTLYRFYSLLSIE